MNWKLLKVFGIILGIISIGIAVLVFTGTVGYYENAQKYSVDAYTGIQNAAAQTANNIMYMGETIQMGLCGLLLVQGLAMFLGALCIQPKKFAVKTVPAEPIAPVVPAPVMPVVPVVAPQPSSWSCPVCRQDNDADFRFCQSCGSPKP